MNEPHELVADGRSIRFYDSGAGEHTVGTLFWHHGTPQSGRILEPVLAPALERGIRVVSLARPGYEGSSPLPGRSVADAAADVIRVADRLGIERFFSIGASGGGPHALGCAALAPTRVAAAVTLAGIAPYTTDFDWFAGMADASALRAALAGREPRAAHSETAEFQPASFIARDWTALSGDWKSLGADAGSAGQLGTEGEVEDDVAYTSPWGFDPADLRVPVLVVQGDADRVVPPAHGDWLHTRIPASEFWPRPGDGHISVLSAYPDALDWVLRRGAIQ